MSSVSKIVAHEARIRSESYALGQQRKGDELRAQHEIDLRAEYRRGQVDGCSGSTVALCIGIAAGAVGHYVIANWGNWSAFGL